MSLQAWGCDICAEEFTDYSSIQIGDNLICAKCLRNIIEPALEHEINYPPFWEGFPLHPKQFWQVFEPAFTQRYEAKEIEYNTAQAKRVYCNQETISCDTDGELISDTCRTFLGERRTATTKNMRTAFRCGKCDVLVCMICDQPFIMRDDAWKHSCAGYSTRQAEEQAAFSNLERGKYWQQCPNQDCMRRVELMEACNHIECPCGTGFCFICGQRAEDGTDHWAVGGCPRYLQPFDKDAQYDEFDSEGEGEDESSESDEEIPLDISLARPPTEAAHPTTWQALRDLTAHRVPRRISVDKENAAADPADRDDESDEDQNDDLDFGSGGSVLPRVEANDMATDTDLAFLYDTLDELPVEDTDETTDEEGSELEDLPQKEQKDGPLETDEVENLT